MRAPVPLLLPLLFFAQTPEPVMRVQARLVTVCAVVRSKNGPVTNLTARDFELLRRGKPQKTAFF